MSKKYIFTYQTLCAATGRTYVGYHSTDNLNDGYIGCGMRSYAHAKGSRSTSHFIRAVLKYGYENFKVQILCFFDTIKEAQAEERFLVDRKWVESKDNYNITEGGRGGGHNKATTLEQDELIFKDFMAGMTKKDIFKKHGITHSILWRITKDRDTSNRTTPTRAKTLLIEKWIKKNKDYYIDKYKSGKLTRAEINEMIPFYLYGNDFLRGVESQVNKYFIYHNNEIKPFNSVKEFTDMTGKDSFIQEFSRCDRNLTATSKGYAIAKSEERLKEKINAIKSKVKTSKYTGTIVFLHNVPHIIEASVAEFCSKHGVTVNNFGMMLSGNTDSANGFTLKKVQCTKLMKDGKVVHVIGRKTDFCKKRGIPLSSYYALIKGWIDNTNGYSRHDDKTIKNGK